MAYNPQNYHKRGPNVNFQAGGSFVNLCPQFSSNAQNVYLAWKNNILGYSVTTGALFVKFKGLKDDIVGFGVHHYHSYECITACSSSGEVITWKIVTFYKLLNKKLWKNNVKTFHLIPSEKSVKALASHEEEDKIVFFVHEEKKSEECNFTLNSNVYDVDICSDKYFAVIQNSSLNIIKLDNLLKTYTFCINQSRRFTCVRCHPEQEMILTGDNTGRVVVWQNIFTSKPTKAVFHWHTLPVRCLSFSTTGSYFYSGGDEAVLVRWQLDNHYEKKFLPRLPSSLAQIGVAPNNMFIAIGTNDNAVNIVHPRFEKACVIQNLVIGDTYKSGIVVDPRTKGLVLNGNIGHIQFYSISDHSLLYNVDVVGQNKVSNERSCNIENTRVHKVAISTSGLWLATVEVRRDLEYSPDLRLKFWIFDVTLQNFKLNTSIEDPHEAEISSIAFQPVAKDLKLVTVAEDKKFKIWYLTETEKADFTSSKVWNCLFVGLYHDLPCEALSFSIDGSLVGVSFDNIITLWLPDSCKWKCSLSHPVCKKQITHLEFGSNKECHLIVAAWSEGLCVWNLLTLTMIWTVPIKVSILIADKITAKMAIISNNNTLYVFSPYTGQIIFTSTYLLKRHKRILAATFVPSKQSNNNKLTWYQRSLIFFINENKELHSIGYDERESESSSEIHESSKSVFSMTLPQTQIDKNRKTEPVEHMYKSSENTVKEYLDAPIQTMIPIRLMCGALLKSMLVDKPQ